MKIDLDKLDAETRVKMEAILAGSKQAEQDEALGTVAVEYVFTDVRGARSTGDLCIVRNKFADKMHGVIVRRIKCGVALYLVDADGLRMLVHEPSEAWKSNAEGIQ